MKTSLFISFDLNARNAFVDKDRCTVHVKSLVSLFSLMLFIKTNVMICLYSRDCVQYISISFIKNNFQYAN